MIACSCCPDQKHVKCQKVIPGMAGGFPCPREPVEDGRCEKHQVRK